MSAARIEAYARSVNRHEPSERVWNALKRLAKSEPGSLSQPEAIKRVKAIARSEGALEMPDPALDFLAREYRSMVMENKKSG